MLCKNTSAQNAKFHIDREPGQPPTVYDVPPGEVVDIPDGYCKPYKGAGNRDMPPIIKQLAPGLKPLGKQAAGVVPTVAPVSGGDGVVTNAQLLQRFGAMADKLEALEKENARLRAATTRRTAAQASPVPVVTGEGDEVPQVDVEREAEEGDELDDGDDETADAKPAARAPRNRAKPKAAQG